MDHVFAFEHLNICRLDNSTGVNVKGWPQLAIDAEKDQWIAEFPIMLCFIVRRMIVLIDIHGKEPDMSKDKDIH